MNTPMTINADEALVIPKSLLVQFPGTKKFDIKPVAGALVIEPADSENAAYTLTSEEEEKLAQSMNEPSLPLASLKD